MQSPQSCDTFVVLPPLTEDGSIIFGKNSDRPQFEVQEVIYVKGGHRPPKVKCTHIMIDQSPHPINSVILSKPAWMWGAEMGANDKNVVIGNEAVWTNYNNGDGDARQKRLLGMDLVRLGLERGNTAVDAMNVIISLLEQYGQGGPCAEDDPTLYYHNSFMIVDQSQAWVLETSGNFWVAERVTRGYRNISNGLTITTHFDRHSTDLHAKARRAGLWDGYSEFNFSKIFAAGGDLLRQIEGDRLLYESSRLGRFDLNRMMLILRQKEYRICRSCDDAYPTQGSQVSRLTPGICVHYFTSTPDTALSCFKPFVFTPDAAISENTTSGDPPMRQHYLHKVHHEHIITKNNTVIADGMFTMEQEYIAEINNRVQQIEAGMAPLSILDNIMKEFVDAEIAHYMLAKQMQLFSI